MKHLKVLRTQHHLSQQQLADYLHISQQSVYKYENSLATPDLQILIAMADLFNCSIDYLVDYSSIPHKIEPVTEISLNENELEMMKSFRKLSPSHMKLVTDLITELSCKK